MNLHTCIIWNMLELCLKETKLQVTDFLAKVALRSIFGCISPSIRHLHMPAFATSLRPCTPKGGHTCIRSKGPSQKKLVFYILSKWHGQSAQTEWKLSYTCEVCWDVCFTPGCALSGKAQPWYDHWPVPLSKKELLPQGLPIPGTMLPNGAILMPSATDFTKSFEPLFQVFVLTLQCLHLAGNAWHALSADGWQLIIK